MMAQGRTHTHTHTQARTTNWRWKRFNRCRRCSTIFRCVDLRLRASRSNAMGPSGRGAALGDCCG